MGICEPQARSLRPLPQGVVAELRVQMHEKVQPCVLLPYLHPSGKGTAADGVDDGIALLPVAGAHTAQVPLKMTLL